VEHGSRANLYLKALADKASITLLRALLDAVEKYGRPHFIRTDNEAVFTSRLFKMGLWILGIKQQTSDPGCPWQNGRIERFFGTLKQKLNKRDVSSLEGLNTALRQFRFWYNHTYPHQNLAGCTPAEVWNAKGQLKWQVSQPTKYFEAWDGLLRGFWFPPPEP
jgi:transposase InsO family protein